MNRRHEQEVCSHRFLIWLSVRPASCLAISAHLFPNRRCDARSASSSAALQSVLVMFGSSWLCQRSRHCLPVRVGSCAAITDHARVPCSPTSWHIFTSSSADHTRRSLAGCGCAVSIARQALRGKQQPVAGWTSVEMALCITTRQESVSRGFKERVDTQI